MAEQSDSRGTKSPISYWPAVFNGKMQLALNERSMRGLEKMPRCQYRVKYIRLSIQNVISLSSASTIQDDPASFYL